MQASKEEAEASTIGPGLGLAVSKRLVELMGGQFGSASRDDGGSTFWFTVPVEFIKDDAGIADPAPADKAAANSAAADTAAPARVDLTGLKILCVDDSPTVSRLTMLQLSSLGAKAVAAMTGREAIAKANAEYFDLILLDLQLPDLSGFEVCQQIREQQRSRGKKRSKIIALTGYSSPSDKEEAAAAGMDDFLTKPVPIEVLRQHLSDTLSSRPISSDDKL